MRFTQGLLNARSHIIFIAGLLFASFSILHLEGWDVRSTSDEVFAKLPSPSARSPRPLSAEEYAWAQIAWQYFERNVRPETGLADSVEQFPATTLWDTGSFLLGLISAYELGVIPESRFDAMTDQALVSLAKLPLFEDRLPNKSYNTISLAMVDYENNESATGIGWSAIDIGRLLVPLNILVWRYPAHADKAAEAIASWDFDSVVREGTLYGADIKDGATRLVQEGRLGYEEYSARTFGLLGLDVSEARRYDDYLTWAKVGSERVGADTRTAELYGAHNYVLSEPYMLDGLEFGWDRASRALAYRVYRAQEERFRKTGILTAVTEGHLDRAPYFVYATVFSDGQAWSVLSTAGEDLPELRTLSTKAAFSWHALYRTPYTRSLMDEVSSWYDKERGWMSGRYEESGTLNRSFTCNNNGVILESLNFRHNGPLTHPR